MRRSLYALLLITIAVFAACSGKPGNDQVTVNYLSQHMNNSMLTINKYTETVLAELREKMADPPSAYRATIWYPRAQAIYEYSKEIKKHLDSISYSYSKYSQKEKETIEKRILNHESGQELENEIVEYYRRIAAVDSIITGTFSDQLLFPRKTLLDSLYPVALLEKKITIANAMVLLQQFRSNIMIIESRMIQFCNNKVSAGERWFDVYSAIMSISTEYTLPGKNLEVIAGMGAFSMKAQPVITIAGNPVNIDEDGAAHYKFKASSLPGKHMVPVKIEYINETGKREIIEKTVQYIVAKAD